jgi:hypothetical protein
MPFFCVDRIIRVVGWKGLGLRVASRLWIENKDLFAVASINHRGVVSFQAALDQQPQRVVVIHLCVCVCARARTFAHVSVSAGAGAGAGASCGDLQHRTYSIWW